MRFIGGKSNLLKDIDTLLNKHLDGAELTFTDLFGGSNVVGQYFKSKFQVTSNDLMYFSYVIARATIQLNKIPSFDRLKKMGIYDPFQYLQSANLSDQPVGYVAKNFSPLGPARRMYFQPENAKRIDYVRETIEDWHSKHFVNSDEYYYLLDSLIEGIPFISNITGTYGAYLKHWDKRTYKPLQLVPNEIINNHATNMAFQSDSLQLVKKKSGDIVYIDPPYNSRQYAPNYHVLETIARWDKPVLMGVTGQRPTDDEKSTFSMKRSVKASMEKLFSNLHYKHVVVSYSTDGILPITELRAILKDNAVNGEVEMVSIPYRKYKSKIINPKTEVKELLFYFKSKHYQIAKAKNQSKKIIASEPASSGGYIKSPLNYIGGKYKLLPQILPLFPKDIDTFVDLFSGGGNVGINVKSNRVIFNDINSKINGLFRYFQGKNPDQLISEINARIEKYHLSKTNQKGFQEYRNAYNCNPMPIDLYTLVAYSFNYQFRFNNNLKYNNPFGRNRSHFSKQMESNLRRFVRRLNEIDAIFTDCYFNKLNISDLTYKSFVYADPPYLITTGSYNDGNRGFVNWTERQDQELFQFLDNLSDRGVRFALSNVMEHKGRKNDLLIEWAAKYHIHYLDYSYSNASHNTKHAGSCEVLITNY